METESSSRRKAQPWTLEEASALVAGVQKHGRRWKKIGEENGWDRPPQAIASKYYRLQKALPPRKNNEADRQRCAQQRRKARSAQQTPPTKKSRLDKGIEDEERAEADYQTDSEDQQAEKGEKEKEKGAEEDQCGARSSMNGNDEDNDNFVVRISRQNAGAISSWQNLNSAGRSNVMCMKGTITTGCWRQAVLLHRSRYSYLLPLLRQK